MKQRLFCFSDIDAGLFFLPGLYLSVFGRLFVEVLEAAFAAQVNVGAFMGDFYRIAHFAKFFARNRAGLERIVCRGRFGGWKGSEAEKRGRKKCECKFHEMRLWGWMPFNGR